MDVFLSEMPKKKYQSNLCNLLLISCRNDIFYRMFDRLLYSNKNDSRSLQELCVLLKYNSKDD